MKMSLSDIACVIVLTLSMFGQAVAETSATSVSSNTSNTSNSTTPEKVKWLPRDNDLRILEVKIQSYKFEDFVPAYQYQDVVLLPLGMLTEIMELGVTVSPGYAEGFVIREDRTFYLDVVRNEIVINGKPEPFDSTLVYDIDGDIYVESNLLGKWLYMDFNINLFSAVMEIKSEEKLPFLKKIEREEKIKKALSRHNADDRYYPKHYEPYKMLSVPFLDQSLTLGRQKNKGSDAFNKYQYTTYVSADVLYHEGAMYLSGDEQEGLDSFRLRLGRKDAEGELLGFMKATEYAAGNVTETRVDLINLPSEIETGISAGNYDLGRQLVYDRHRFVGVLLPGWEVELYHNNALIGYQPAPINGLYDFVDIPLLFGNNYFRLVFYGPNGKVREEEQFFQLDQSLTKKGQHNYHFTATDDEDGGERVTVQYDYGLSKNVSTTFNYVDIPLDELGGRKQHQYLKAGLRGFWQAFFFDFNFYDDLESGDAIELSLNTRYGSTVFGLTDVVLNNFFSEEFAATATAINRRTTALIDTAIPATFLPRMPIRFELIRDEFASGTERLDFVNTISASVRGFALSNQFRRITGDSQPSLTTGSLQLSTGIERLRLRSTLSYELEPDSSLTNASITADPSQQFSGFQLSFGVNHSLAVNLTEYSVSANKGTGKYNLSFGARYNSNDEFNLDMRLSFGFGYEPRRKSWESNALAVANQGSVSARVFLDNDEDGIYSDSDEPLENVGFRLNNGYSDSRTDEGGIVFITGLQPYQPIDVVIAPETLEDPLWTAALDGINVVPRPGNSIVLDFPVFMTGEVDGTVSLNKDGQVFGVGNVEVQLVDKSGRVLQSVETAYDGFYIISKISFGEYFLRISEKQIEALNLQPVNNEPLVLTVEDPFKNGYDFTLYAR